MQLTAAQQATFKTWLTNNTAGLADQAAADLANAAASYFVWQTAASKNVIDAAINKANFTPTDNPPASTNTTQGTNDALLFNNRVLAAQMKQTNAQWLTGNGATNGSLDCRVVQVRQNFKDCLTAVPAGAGGTAVDAGWGTASVPGAVRLAMMRSATNFEKLYVTAAATGPGNDGVAGNRGTNTNPDLLGVDALGGTIEGQVTSTMVAETRAS